ncbi:MAG: lectin-like protein [Planctomycetota bacterium]
MGKLVLAVLIFASGLATSDTLSERWKKRLESADTTYQAAVQKADNTRLYAVQKATQERTRLLKTALADATKAGDFDAATELKTRLTAAESEGSIRPKPKNTVRFGGHEYALIDEKETWHVAKRKCEEMGGHLVTFDNASEMALASKLCTTAQFTWGGASDEVTEGQWLWVTGEKLADTSWIHFDQEENNHYLGFILSQKEWLDCTSVHRSPYICEWDH